MWLVLSAVFCALWGWMASDVNPKHGARSCRSCQSPGDWRTGAFPHRALACDDFGGRVADGADSPAAVGWPDRARTVALVGSVVGLVAFASINPCALKWRRCCMSGTHCQWHVKKIINSSRCSGCTRVLSPGYQEARVLELSNQGPQKRQGRSRVLLPIVFHAAQRPSPKAPAFCFATWECSPPPASGEIADRLQRNSRPAQAQAK